MADTNFNGPGQPGGAERGEIVPASSVLDKSGSNQLIVRSGFGRVQNSAPAFDPMMLMKSFRRRWTLAIGLGFLAAVVVGVTAVLVMPPAKYSTRAILRVSQFVPRIIFTTGEQQTEYQTFRSTQLQLIRSAVVLGPALRDPKVAALPVVKAQPDPLQWLEEQVLAAFPANAEVLTISMTSANPLELEPIVDAVVKSYMDTVVEEDHQARVARLESLKKMYDKYQEDLRTKRTSLRTLSNTVGTDDRQTLALKQGFELENLQYLQRELMAIETQLRKFKTALPEIEKVEKIEKTAETTETAAKDAPAQAPTKPKIDEATITQAIETKVANDPRVHEMSKELDRLKNNYYRMKGLTRSLDDPALSSARAKYRAAIAARDDLKDHIRDDIMSNVAMQAEQAGANPSGTTVVNGQPVTNKSLVTRYKAEISALERGRGDLVSDIDKRRTEIMKLNGTTIDLQTEQADIALLGDTAHTIGKEVEALEVELMAPKRITLLAKAETPRRKEMMKQYLMCGGAAFGAFALAILGVSFWEMRSMRIGSVDEVVNHLGIALVGALPALPNRNGRLSKADDQRWQGLLVESIDATRTMLLHSSRANSTRAVLITSAMKGEGKTSLSAHLATSLARSGRKTLLIDCDLRRPQLHQLFDVPRVPGLCELLRGEAELNDVIRPTPVDDLNMIPAGHCDGMALQAIAQDGVRDILNVLKKRYDFIIIDSAPVLPVVDTMLLSQQVDAVLFSIMRDVSRIPHVQAAYERLSTLGVKILGAVVSAAERRDYMHMYDYEYQTVESA
jgi:capsular exopolysaccharide synthesis family protein